MKFQNIDPRRLESIHPKSIHGKRKFGGNYFLNKRRKSIGDDIDGGEWGRMGETSVPTSVPTSVFGGDIEFYQSIKEPMPPHTMSTMSSRVRNTNTPIVQAFRRNKNEGRTSFEQLCGIDRGKSDL